ncbi:MAG: hypothetical protein AAFY27_03200 [Pseudomonadota bacterium]
MAKRAVKKASKRADEDAVSNDGDARPKSEKSAIRPVAKGAAKSGSKNAAGARRKVAAGSKAASTRKGVRADEDAAGAIRGEVKAPGAGSGRAPAQKVKAQAAPAATRGARPSEPEETIEMLRRELAAARARIIELEQRQSEVMDRIDWVLDALQSAVGAGAEADEQD